MSAHGVEAHGWDPVHLPDGPLLECDVVNLGYVVNVIEDPGERVDVVRAAWALCRDLLVVSARGLEDQKRSDLTQYGDGFISSRKTFQKFFSHLRGFLGVSSGFLKNLSSAVCVSSGFSS